MLNASMQDMQLLIARSIHATDHQTTMKFATIANISKRCARSWRAEERYMEIKQTFIIAEILAIIIKVIVVILVAKKDK